MADAVAVDQNLVGLAGGAGVAVRGGSGAGWADLAGAVDSSQSGEAAAALGGWVIDLIGTAFSSTDTPLVGEESIEAVAVLSGSVVSRVDRAGHTVSVGDEEVIGAALA